MNKYPPANADARLEKVMPLLPEGWIDRSEPIDKSLFRWGLDSIK